MRCFLIYAIYIAYVSQSRNHLTHAVVGMVSTRGPGRGANAARGLVQLGAGHVHGLAARRRRSGDETIGSILGFKFYVACTAPRCVVWV